MSRWAELQENFSEHFFHTAKILVAILFHAVLLVVWVLIDRGAEHLCEELKAKGFHAYVTEAFRWITSITVLLLAVTPALMQVIEIVGSFKKKVKEELGEPAKPPPIAEKTE